RARPAFALAASFLGSGEKEVFAQYVEESRCGICFDVCGCAVEREAHQLGVMMADGGGCFSGASCQYWQEGHRRVDKTSKHACQYWQGAPEKHPPPSAIISVSVAN